MNKNYYYKNYPEIAQAMKVHNTINSGPNFTLVDFNILCIVKSFNDSGSKCYISNDQLAHQLISCEKTIRTSINRLCKAGFLEKQAAIKGRCLICKEEKIAAFIEDMQHENI